MAGKNHFEQGKLPPLLPSGIGERYCQTKSNLGCELPL
jgi:hypothetical protein